MLIYDFVTQGGLRIINSCTLQIKNVLIMKNRLSILGCFLGFFFGFSSYAQQYPYPQNLVYPYGYMSSNITNNDAWSEYQAWINSYYVECSGSEARINYNGNTVSEGIGYGLVITAYAGDKVKFDKLWNYYNNRKNGSGVMHWEYSGCTTNASGTGAATDGDLDAVMGLLVAVHQWPGEGYESKFETLANAIRTSEFTNCGLIVQKPGDAWGGCDCTNPSYYAPGYYRAFAAYYNAKGDANNGNFWNQAANDSYVVLFANQHPSSGLVSAWTNSNGAAGPCGGQVGGGGGADTYQYDACRTPWRIATDYLWWGSEDAHNFLVPIVNFVNTTVGGITNVKDGYRHDGSLDGEWHNVPFVGSFALAGMATSQRDVDAYMSHFAGMNGDNYFNTCLAVMYKFLATGNFWNPYSTEPPVRCSDLTLGSEKTLCGSGSANLVLNVSSGNGRNFEWFRDGAMVSSGSTNSYLATQAGTYTVTMDSAGVCTSETQVVVSASLPSVDLGGTVYMGTSTVLDAQITGAGIQYSWSFNGSVIQGQTARTLTVTEPGTYSVEVSTVGCASQTDEVSVEQLPYIAQTSANIAIDGTKDDAYGNGRNLNQMLSGSIGAPDIAATWYGLWNNSNLYVFIDITDNDLSRDSGGNWWEDDGAEIFIDGANNKGTSYDGDDMQIGLVWEATEVIVGGSTDGSKSNGVQYSVVQTANGYAVEASIPWSTVGVTPAVGNSIGIDFAINDDDNGAGRENKISWNAPEDNGWQNPSLFGTVSLAEEQTQQEETQTVQLQNGWNIVCLMVAPQNLAISSVFPNARTVKTMDDVYSKNHPSFLNTITSLEAGKTYLIYVDNSQQVQITGTSVVAQNNLISGWNLYSPNTSGSIQNVMNDVYNSLNTVKDFNSFWRMSGGGTLTQIEKGKGYFVKLN